MHLEHIARHLENKHLAYGLEYSLGSAATDEDIEKAEHRLGLRLPAQVEKFYRAYNGLRVEEPHIEILSLETISRGSPERLHFATINHSNELYFDTSRINAAGQWSIVTSGGYQITFTMASFWSNKLWRWINQQQPIWEPEPNAAQVQDS